eukprot:GHVQ01017329.1.p1 GENE.GHVQ01017329.1~~GHVQ01017329.1.p1  ORF type:complete len:150 (+),score=9.63 GHVQ01017329.1:109-558(+)
MKIIGYLLVIVVLSVLCVGHYCTLEVQNAEAGMAEGGMAVGGNPKSGSRRTCLQLIRPEVMVVILMCMGGATVVFRLMLQYLGQNEMKNWLTGTVVFSLCATSVWFVCYLISFIWNCYRLGDTVSKTGYQKQPNKKRSGKRAPADTTAV